LKERITVSRFSVTTDERPKNRSAKVAPGGAFQTPDLGLKQEDLVILMTMKINIKKKGEEL